METAVIARRHQFSSAHLYKQNKFTEEQNQAEFGACFNPFGHGHNYIIEAFIEGPIEPKIRLVMDLAHLDKILVRVCEPLDHRHLNFEIAEFKEKIPTTENIALYLFEKINQELVKFPGVRLQRIRLFETDDLWVELWAGRTANKE